MKLRHNVGPATVALSLAIQLFADQEHTFQPENPVTSEWLTRRLQQQSPKLMLMVSQDAIHRISCLALVADMGSRPTACRPVVGQSPKKTVK